MYVYIYICVYLYMCVYVYVCMYVYVCVYICVYVYVCVCMCMCVCVCIYIQLYIFTVTLMKIIIYLDVNTYLSLSIQLGVCTNDKSIQLGLSSYQIALYRQLTIINLATGYLASQLTILNTIFFSIYLAATRALKAALAIFNTYIGRPTLPQIISYMNHKIYQCNKLFISTSFYSEIAQLTVILNILVSACQWGQLILPISNTSYIL